MFLFGLPWYFAVIISIILILADKYYYKPRRTARLLREKEERKIRGSENKAEQVTIRSRKQEPKPHLLPFVIGGAIIAVVTLSISAIYISSLEWDSWEGYHSMLKAGVALSKNSSKAK